MPDKKNTGIIGGVFMAHAPQFFTLPESEDKKTVNRVKRLAKALNLLIKIIRMRKKKI